MKPVGDGKYECGLEPLNWIYCKEETRKKKTSVNKGVQMFGKNICLKRNFLIKREGRKNVKLFR